MKTCKFLFSFLLFTIPFIAFAQEWDDIYANPEERSSRNFEKEIYKENQKKKIVVIEGNASDMRVRANGRDIDEYNRRRNDSHAIADEAQPEIYEDYQYTDRIVKFHDPQSSVKITGANDVTIYVGDNLYSDYYENRGWNYNVNFGWNSYYPWYSSWGYRYYSPYYSGYYGWYDPWYDPWYYGSWYSPWYYGGWYSPWYYRAWHSPWYYGGGGYYSGFYDGYYAGKYYGLERNRSGRSSGIYRGSTYSRSSLGRSGDSRYRGSSAYSSGRASSAYSGRSSSVRGSSRTRVVDSNSGRVYDSRSGRVIDRVARYGSSSRGVYGGRGNSAVRSSSRRSYSTFDRNGLGSSSRGYSAPSRGGSRGYSVPSRGGSRGYSAPSRSSSSSSRSYTPSRSSSSSRSSSWSSSSSSRSSSGSGSSSRSGGGRR